MAAQTEGKPSLKIIFDEQVFNIQSVGGISRYFVEMGEKLALKGHAVWVSREIGVRNWKRFPYPLKNIKQKWVGLYFPFGSHRLQRFIPFKRFIPSQLLQNRSLYAYKYLLHLLKPDILHYTYHFNINPSYRGKKATTLHDFIHEIYDLDSLITPVGPKRIKQIEDSDLIICISEQTRRDFGTLYGDKYNHKVIKTIYHGSTHFQNATLVQPYAHPRPYFFYVGQRGLYKNFASIVRAFGHSPALKAKYDIIALGGAFNAKERALLAEFGLTNQVHSLQGDDQKLVALYKGAKALVYSSLYEGFGMPILEAFELSCPVLCSNRASMPEVAGDAALYFNPIDLLSIQEAMLKLDQEPGLGSALIAKGLVQKQKFSWDKCADETLQGYYEVLAQN